MWFESTRERDVVLNIAAMDVGNDKVKEICFFSPYIAIYLISFAQPSCSVNFNQNLLFNAKQS